MPASHDHSDHGNPPSSPPCSMHEVDPVYMGLITEERRDKRSPGRGYVVVIYSLYIGSIMTLVSAPLGALIAHLRLGRGARWIDTHLRFQIRTFWLGLMATLLALITWHLAGLAGLPPVYAWSFGYVFATLGITWMMARCAVGVHRLTSNEAIDAPESWLFGLGKKT